MYDNIWLVLPGTKELVSPYELYPKSKPIKAAQPFTVSMVAVVVAEDLDGIFRGRNDILVLTKSSLGEQPKVERVHCYEEEIDKGRPIRHIFAENVCIADDYSGNDRLWLELNVLEIDSDTGERKAAVSAFQNLATTAGAVFPVFVQYSFAASAAVGVIEKLIDALEKDTNVVKVKFSLYPDEPQPGKPPFQSGTYVVFAGRQDPNKYKLQSNGLLTTGNKPSEVSYAVFSISPQKRVSPNFVMNQKIATLLTQIHFGNGNTSKSTFDFLNSTLSSYSNYKKLNRYIELKKKSSPTDEEKALMEEIANIAELKPFIA